MATSEFPVNTKLGVTPAEPKPEPEPKKIEQVTENPVTRRKKPLRRRFMETFIQGEAKGVGSYLVQDVLIPAAKDTISDAMSQGIDRLLFGESRGRNRRPQPNTGGFINYSRMGAPTIRQPEPARPMTRQSRATHNFDEIVLATRQEADEVLERLYDLVNKYEVATVSDLYELVGVTGQYTDDKWGWTDLRGSTVSRISGGYLLDLPRTEPVN